MPATLRRVRLRVEGTVQGVGFRPYVYRLAGALGLAGWVLNDSRGVLVEVEGGPAAVSAFVQRLPVEAPPLAVLEGIDVGELTPRGEAGFRIRESPQGGEPDAPVAADSATCQDCLAELFDPADRRYRYPFINCTNCGPRFTIVTGVPYDRPATTMAAFTMCQACRAEYEDPADRRFHAQPNACPECGPRARLQCAGDSPPPATAAGPLASADAVAAAASELAAGAIVAIKGIGGYHLACRADDEEAVAALRARKHREEKPFALMVASLAAAQGLAEIGETERALLLSPARPIVLVPRRRDARVAGAVAPSSAELGLMLPYAPLHHLLLADLADAGITAIVLTSGNVSDEPIAYRDDDALDRLGAIADLILLHDRPIATRTDDSVLRAGVAPGTPPLVLRRSRGYVPEALALPRPAPVPVLGCGAELKSTFCLAKETRAWVSHHIGDLQNLETLQSFTDGIAHFEELFAATPAVLAHDLHPEYLSSKYAAEREHVELVAVQHHHAHLAATLAEHRIEGPALGAIFDGTGLGTDGTVWGGELLLGDVRSFRRVGHLRAARLPGGERAIREPWRMACAWLTELAHGVPELPPSLAGAVSAERWVQVAELALRGFRAPVTTSAGRLCDAAAALCGIRPVVSYEGQAAIELESLCAPAEAEPYPGSVLRDADGIVLDPGEMLRALLADHARGITAPILASRFHAGFAELTARGLTLAASEQGVETVVLSGGVFANQRLLHGVFARLADTGLRVLVPERLPAGDGGISFGQVAVAIAQLEELT